jgi:hypothetical protein
MPVRKSASTQKPLVFLSHSSANRRELRHLKDFLNLRAAGMVDFFLSSDDESIRPGRLWSNEVKDALDRMRLILIFASKEALESPWTFFEAGYGLCATESATVYCLKGCAKDTLSSPFSELQNRNLHSASDLRLLIEHCNKVIGSSMSVHVTKTDFEKIFPLPLKTGAKAPPSLPMVVEKIQLQCDASPSSIGLFIEACEFQGHLAVEFASHPPNQDHFWLSPKHWPVYQPLAAESWAATGIHLTVSAPSLYKTLSPRKFEDVETNKNSERMPMLKSWLTFLEPETLKGPLRSLLAPLLCEAEGPDPEWMTVSKLDFNKIEKGVAWLNGEIERRNAEFLFENRLSSFNLAPDAFETAAGLYDAWRKLQPLPPIAEVEIDFRPTVRRELRPERIAAAVYGTQLALNRAGSLIWNGGDQALDFEAASTYALPPSHGDVEVTKMKFDLRGTLLDFDLAALIRTLFQTEILRRVK